MNVTFCDEPQGRDGRRPSPQGGSGSGRLVLRIEGGGSGIDGDRWADDDIGKLELKLARVAAAVIVAGEANLRTCLREDEAWREKMRLLEQKRQQEHLAELAGRRLEELRKSGELLRQAEDLRSLVAAVKLAALAGTAKIEPATLCEWESWALEEADRIDPLKSGQVMKHLIPPDEASQPLLLASSRGF